MWCNVRECFGAGGAEDAVPHFRRWPKAELNVMSHLFGDGVVLEVVVPDLRRKDNEELNPDM